ncbi:MAG: hydrogenase maturation protease [Chloroflexota bacterium]
MTGAVSSAPPGVVIGLGRPLRRDDAAGLLVAERLSAAGRGRIPVVPYRGDAAGLLELLSGSASAVVVDALRCGGPAGTVHSIGLDALLRTAQWGPGASHRASLAEVLALAAAMGRPLPAIRVIGIEVGEVGLGEGLTVPVAAAVDRVVALLLEELQCTSSI